MELVDYLSSSSFNVRFEFTYPATTEFPAQHEYTLVDENENACSRIRMSRPTPTSAWHIYLASLRFASDEQQCRLPAGSDELKWLIGLVQRNETRSSNFTVSQISLIDSSTRTVRHTENDNDIVLRA